MHLASEAVTLECAALGFVVAASGVGYSLWNLRALPAGSETPSRLAAKSVALGSLVFAAQMLNLPILANSSVHFIGGVLLAELLGPALGVLTMSAILLLQAILLGDGGLAALGVNITNMACLPAVSLILARRCVANRNVAVGAASLASVVLAVLLIGGEVALTRSAGELSQWSTFVSALLTNHLPLLPLEAALTLALVVLARSEKVAERSAWRVPAMATMAAIVIALVATTTSSSLPDGYESAATVAQMNWLLGH
jgi:cobalt/nickel transport system permease protein